MRDRLAIPALAIIGLSATGVCGAVSGQDVPSSYQLEVASIGFPAARQQKAAQRISALKFVGNRLYIGHGNMVVNTGPTDVIYYDLATGQFHTEFTVDDEEIHRYCVLDGQLAIPGSDATEDWSFGNVYVREEGGWRKHRTVPNGLHVCDMVSYKGRWYCAAHVCITSFAYGTKEQPGDALVFSTADKGSTWQFEYAAPYDINTDSFIWSLVSYKSKVYAFPAARSYPYTESFAQSKGPVGPIDDFLGAEEGVAYDGLFWRPVDLIEERGVRYVTPFLVGDKLALWVEFGGKGQAGAKSALYAFDGEKTVKHAFECEYICAVSTGKSKTWLLTRKEKRWVIAETEDLSDWKFYYLPPAIRQPISLDSDGASFYIGTEDGNVFKSVSARPLRDARAIEAHEPRRIFGSAELPRDGLFYWAAITDWTHPGETASFRCEVLEPNRIDVVTSNAAGLLVYIPSHELLPGKPVTLNVDGRECYKGRLGSATAFRCLRDLDGRWKADTSQETTSTFRPGNIVVGNAKTTLAREGVDWPAGRWVADAVQSAAGTDLVVINKGGILRDLKKGEIRVEDAFELHYRNTVCVFEASGETLRRMLDFNVRQVEKARVQIAGFTMEVRMGDEPETNQVVQCSLDPRKTYTVATNNYMARNSKRFLGEEIAYQSKEIPFPRALIRWLKAHRVVEETPRRITTIEGK